jgi:hypothetical protein
MSDPRIKQQLVTITEFPALRQQLNIRKPGRILKRRTRNILFWGVIAFIAVLLPSYLYLVVHQTKVKERVIELVHQEFDRIQPSPGAVRVKVFKSHKSGVAFLEGGYTSNLSEAELRKFYGAQLQAAGWQYLGSTSGRRTKWRNGELTASLFYCGPQRNVYRCDYFFSISWDG